MGLVCVLLGVAALVAALSRGDGQPSGTNEPADCKTVFQRTGTCPNRKTFNAAGYLRHGDAFNCPEFARQADAQSVLRADPSDPDRLDADRDGVACPELGGPKDLRPVQASAARFRCGHDAIRSSRCPRERRFVPAHYLRYSTDVYDCAVFASQADAQAVLRFEPDDPNKLDSDGDGIACPGLRPPKDVKPVATRPPA